MFSIVWAIMSHERIQRVPTEQLTTPCVKIDIHDIWIEHINVRKSRTCKQLYSLSCDDFEHVYGNCI